MAMGLAFWSRGKENNKPPQTNVMTQLRKKRESLYYHIL